MTQVFLSYAHGDRALLDKSLVHLRPIFEEMGLKLWWANDLAGGSIWNAQIATAIDASDIFLCLVTPHFVDSTYIRDHELPAIYKAYNSRGALVIPILLKSCNWALRFRLLGSQSTRNDFTMQCIPTHRGEVRPLTEWRPQAKGWNQVHAQLNSSIADFLETTPKQASWMQPTPNGYRLTDAPRETQRQSTQQQDLLLKAISDVLTRIEPTLPSIKNAFPTLADNIEDYIQNFSINFEEINITRLWISGIGIREVIDNTDRYNFYDVFTSETADKILSETSKLYGIHSALIMTTREGLELTSNVLAAQSTERHQIESAKVLLKRLIGHEGLYESETQTQGKVLSELLNSGSNLNAGRLAEVFLFLSSSIDGFSQLLKSSTTSPTARLPTEAAAQMGKGGHND